MAKKSPMLLILLTLAFGAVGAYWACLSYAQQAEQITITTYYPSPSGDYDQLRARRLVVGTVAMPGANGELNVQGNITANLNNNDAQGLIISDEAQLIDSNADTGLRIFLTQGGAARILTAGEATGGGLFGFYVLSADGSAHRDICVRDIYLCNP